MFDKFKFGRLENCLPCMVEPETRCTLCAQEDDVLFPAHAETFGIVMHAVLCGNCKKEIESARK